MPHLQQCHSTPTEARFHNMSIGRVPGATGIQPSIVTAKGDLIVATASGSVTNQAVGSNNQVLTADSAQADGVKWANGSAATLTTTGDLLYASAANTPARLGIGSTNQVLTVSGGVPSWSTLNAGGMTQLATASFGGAAISFQNISQDYKSLVIFVNNAVSAFRLNNETGTNYINLIADTRTQAVGSAVITQYYQPDLSLILGSYYTGANDNVGAHQYIEIPNYASTSCRKIARSAAMGNNGTYWWFNQIWGGRTNSNDAVSRVDLTATYTNGSATLFGVK